MTAGFGYRPAKEEREAAFLPLPTYSVFGKKFVSVSQENNLTTKTVIVSKVDLDVYMVPWRFAALNSETRFCGSLADWAGATATLIVATKWGRSSPVQCFAYVQLWLCVTRNSWNLLRFE